MLLHSASLLSQILEICTSLDASLKQLLMRFIWQPKILNMVYDLLLRRG